MKNPNGLHVRPASRLVSTLSGFRADMLLEKNGKCVTPDSLNQIALLQVRCNDTLRLIAKGEQADEALAAFKQLAAENFGESVEETPASSTARQLPRRSPAWCSAIPRCTGRRESDDRQFAGRAAAPANGDSSDAGRSQRADHAGGREILRRSGGDFFRASHAAG